MLTDPSSATDIILDGTWDGLDHTRGWVKGRRNGLFPVFVCAAIISDLKARVDHGYPKGVEEEKGGGLFVVPAVIYAGKGIVFVSFGVTFLKRERRGWVVKGETEGREGSDLLCRGFRG